MRKVAVPDDGAESLFGSYDENLKHLEAPVHVRIRTSGHELIVEGESADVARSEKRARAAVTRSCAAATSWARATCAPRLARWLAGRDRRADRLFPAGAPRDLRQAAGLPKSVNQRRYLDAIDRHDIVFGIGPAGTGKTYLAMAQAVVLSGRQEGDAASSSRGRPSRRGRSWVSAGRPAGEGQPVPAAAVRRAVRHAGDRPGRAHARARHGRGRADRVHARPYAQRRVRHPGRGAEHHVGTDEDVPDAPGVRVQGRHHRGRDADRPADRPAVGPGRGAESRRERWRGLRSSTSTRRTSSATRSSSRS
jgi:hypothetical protein